MNTLRQRADALAQPLIWVERSRRASLWHTCIDYSPVRAIEAGDLHALHERTMGVLVAEGIECAHMVPPWADEACASVHPRRGAQSAMPREVDALSRPVWALPECIAAFGFDRQDVASRKQCKALADALAHEWGTHKG